MAATGKAVKEALKEVEIVRPEATPRNLADPMPGQAQIRFGEEEEVAEDILFTRLGEIDPDDTHQLNFDKIATTDDIKETIAGVAERNQGRIDEARRETITNEQLAGLAEDLSIDVDIVGAVMTRESGGVLNAEQILGARQVLHKSAQRLRRLAAKVQVSDATDAEKLAFRRQFEWHSEYQTQFMGARAEAGRALSAFNIPVGTDDMQLGRLTELADTMQGGDVREMAELVMLADTLQGINKATREYRGSRTLGVLQELFINSILSGVKTQVVNTSGGAIFQLMNIAEHAVAAQIGRVLPGDTHVEIGEASAMLFGSMSSWRNALKVAGKTLRTGQTPDNSAKFETPIQPAISSQTFPEVPAADKALKEKYGIDTPILTMALDGLGPVVRFPTERMMTSQDEFVKTLLYQSAVAQMAHRETAKALRLGQITDDQVDDFVRNYLTTPPKETAQYAEDYALAGTFQTPLGKKGQAIQRVVNQTPGLKFVAPFIKTPVNLFKQAFADRSPFGLLSERIRNDIKNGGPQRDLALARLSMSSLTCATVSVAVANGRVTGGGPSNHEARKVLEATGWQPYSIVVTDPTTGKKVYQSYARMEPLAFVIGAIADATELLSHVDFEDELTPEEEAAMQLVNGIVAGVAENTMSKTFLSGINDFLNAVEDPDRYLDSYLKRQGGAFVPYSSLRRDFSRIQDPYMREAWTMVDKLKKDGGIPGFSESLAPGLDIYGDARQYPTGAILGPQSPWPDSKERDKPIAHRIAALMEESNRVPVTMPRRRVDGIRLIAIEYYSYVNLSRNEIRIDGMDFEESLTDLMDSTAFEMMGPDGKVDMVKQRQRQFDAAARRELEELYDTGEPNSLAERLRRRRTVNQERKLGDLL